MHSPIYHYVIGPNQPIATFNQNIYKYGNSTYSNNTYHLFNNGPSLEYSIKLYQKSK